MQIIEQTITGYKFPSFQQFTAVKNAVNVHYGYPKEGCVTQTYVDYSESVDENGDLDFYYIAGDISPVLGNPTEFQVRILIPE